MLPTTVSVARRLQRPKGLFPSSRVFDLNRMILRLTVWDWPEGARAGQPEWP